MSIVIGKNAKHNWKLLSDSLPTDYIFHLSDYPSPYIMYSGELDKKKAKELARLCIEHSKYSRGKVDYTTCNNVRKTQKIGEFKYKNMKKVITLNIK